VRDLVAPRLALCDLTAHQSERLEEEGADVVWLQLPRLRFLHLLADHLDVGRAHHLGEQSALLQSLPQLLADGGINDLVELCPDFRLIAVAHRFDQEVTERGVLEDLVPEHIEDATAECL
jgi:hypothetical protein